MSIAKDGFSQDRLTTESLLALTQGVSHPGACTEWPRLPGSCVRPRSFRRAAGSEGAKQEAERPGRGCGRRDSGGSPDRRESPAAFVAASHSHRWLCIARRLARVPEANQVQTGSRAT